MECEFGNGPLLQPQLVGAVCDTAGRTVATRFAAETLLQRL